MKTKIITVILLFFTTMGTIFAQNNDTLFIKQDSPGGNGRSWNTAFPDFATAIQNMPQFSNVVIFVGHGRYEEPVEFIMWRDSLYSLEIYGGCYGYETAPEHRMLNLGSAYRTVIDASRTSDFAVQIATSSQPDPRCLIDNITIHGGNITEGSAIEIIGDGEVTFSRCRIEQTYSPGNLIFAEGLDRGNVCVSFINCVIADNTADRSIFEAYKSFRIINSTLANNSAPVLFEEGLGGGQPDMFLEIQNSILYNTVPYSDANYPVNVSYSVLDDIGNLYDMGMNIAGYDPQFMGMPDNPYQCMPGSIVEGVGNIAYLNVYDLFCRQQDIIGNNRTVFGIKLDAGAYQSQTPPGMRSPEKHSEEEAGQGNFSGNISLYPTKLSPGETLYLEKDRDGEYAVRFFNSNGAEMLRRNFTSMNEYMTVTLPSGVYIVVISDSSGNVEYRDKVIVM